MTSNEAATGMGLARQGRFAEALPYLEHANRLAPADVRLLHAAASVMQTAGRGGEAAELYRIAASLLPGNLVVLSGWARALLLIGQKDHALELLERALLLDDHYADRPGLLETLLREINNAEAVCSLLAALAERQPNHNGLFRRYANALLDAERLQEAQEILEHLRILRPEDPYPRVELGRLAVSRGDTGSARAHFRSALDVDAGYAAALWELAQIDGWQIDAETRDRVELLCRTERNPKALAGLHDILARHSARSGDFVSASQQAERTNALMASIVPPGERYDDLRHASEIDATIRNYAPRLFQHLHGSGNNERRAVFVIGLPRSGTTLLEQMLASHPAIVGVGEQGLALASLNRALAGSGGTPATLTAPAVGAAAAWHLGMLEQRLQLLATGQRADRIVDKMPDNYLLAGWLHIAFPGATIIHCVRDPRDVALSCWLTQFADLRWSNDMRHIAHRIEQHRRLMRHWRAAIGEHLTEIRYEMLVAGPEGQLRRVLAAMHLEWHPDMLDFSGRGSFVASASRLQVRKPLHARSVGRWRNYEESLGPVLARLDAVAAQDLVDLQTIAQD